MDQIHRIFGDSNLHGNSASTQQPCFFAYDLTGHLYIHRHFPSPMVPYIHGLANHATVMWQIIDFSRCTRGACAFHPAAGGTGGSLTVNPRSFPPLSKNGTKLISYKKKMMMLIGYGP